MRILFLTTELPWPLDGGGKLRSFETLACLLPLGEVTVLAVSEDRNGALAAGELAKALPGLRVEPPVIWPVHIRRRPVALARTLLEVVGTGAPYLAAKFQSKVYRARARELAVGTDVVWCDHLNVFSAARMARSVAGARLILDEHNVESDLFRAAAGAGGVMALAARLEAPRAERFERRALADADQVVAISGSDASRLATLGGADRVVTVLPSAGILRAERPPPPAVPVVVMLGTLSWPPNAEAARFLALEVLPELRKLRADVRIRIGGRGLSSRDAEVLRGAGVELADGVPDADAFLRSGGVVAVPTRSGSGISMKTLDALRACVPLVSTSVGARGLPLRDGEEALIADSPRSFAGALVRALSDSELRAKLGRSGHEYLLRYHARQRLTETYAMIMGADRRQHREQP